eukprot:4552143-Pyramimonas_sp.AAC.1
MGAFSSSDFHSSLLSDDGCSLMQADAPEAGVIHGPLSPRVSCRSAGKMPTHRGKGLRRRHTPPDIVRARAPRKAITTSARPLKLSLPRTMPGTR